MYAASHTDPSSAETLTASQQLQHLPGRQRRQPSSGLRETLPTTYTLQDAVSVAVMMAGAVVGEDAHPRTP
jgi:hypothetical protein